MLTFRLVLERIGRGHWAAATALAVAIVLGYAPSTTAGGDFEDPQPTLTEPSEGAVVGERPTFRGFADLTGMDLVAVEVFVGGTTAGSPALTLHTDPDDATGEYLAESPFEFPDGEYIARAVQRDAADNVGRSDPNRFTVNTTAPPTPRCRGLEVTIEAAPDQPTHGTPGVDVILGTSGDDLIIAGGKGDIVCALGGDDRIRGGAGGDQLFAGSGDDILRGDRGADRGHGGSGNDRCASVELETSC